MYEVVVVMGELWLDYRTLTSRLVDVPWELFVNDVAAAATIYRQLDKLEGIREHHCAEVVENSGKQFCDIQQMCIVDPFPIFCDFQLEKVASHIKRVFLESVTFDAFEQNPTAAFADDAAVLLNKLKALTSLGFETLSQSGLIAASCADCVKQVYSLFKANTAAIDTILLSAKDASSHLVTRLDFS